MSEVSTYALNDKVVIVTGAGSGNGEATAIQFAKYGSRVVVNDKDAENAERVSKLCDEASPFNYKSLVHTGDLTDEKVCEELIQNTVKHFNRIDVLVNNAGILSMASILDDDFWQKYDQIMNINTRVPLRLSKLAMPHLLNTKGCIVNVTSIASQAAGLNLTHYSMSKAAVDAMTRGLAFDFGPEGVRVVSVTPSAIMTNIHHTINCPENLWIEKGKTYPLRRPGQPSEVANAVCFAASNAASFITGSSLFVDGGYLLNN